MASINPSTIDESRRSKMESIFSIGLKNKTTNERKYTTFEAFLFFYCGVGATLCPTSILSCLIYYDEMYGRMTYVMLNLVIFLPLLPLSISQSIWDLEYDRKFGSRATFFFRGSVGFLLSFLILTIPFESSLITLLILSFFIGVAGSIIQGSLLQMVSFVSPDDSGLKVRKRCIICLCEWWHNNLMNLWLFIV